MKHLLSVSFFLFILTAWTQDEKGCQIEDRFIFAYEGEVYSSTSNYYSDIWPSYSTSEFSRLDTFKIAIDENKDIVIKWNYFNEYYDMFYPAYDTVQWYYNDTLLEVDNYSFSSSETSVGCGGTYRAGSAIKEVELGYYQLRYIGADTSLDKTNYPVVRVYEPEEADLTEEESPSETILYPNPAKSLVNLKLSKPINSGVMQIHNLQGKLVLSYPINNIETTAQYDISQLNQGLYVFSVIDKEKGEGVLRKKMVVQ